MESVPPVSEVPQGTATAATEQSASTSANTLEFVPIVTQLNQAYQDVNGNIKSKHQPRYKNIVQRFK